MLKQVLSKCSSKTEANAKQNRSKTEAETETEGYYVTHKVKTPSHQVQIVTWVTREIATFGIGAS